MHKTAIVGCGFIADLHLRTLLGEGLATRELISVCESDPERLHRFASQWNITTRFSSLDEMLSEWKPQVVHILVPPGLHFVAAQKCLHAGCHSLVEKPLVLTEEHCTVLTTLAQQNNLHLGVNHNLLRLSAVQSLLNLIKLGRIGGILRINIEMHSKLRQIDEQRWNHWLFKQPTNSFFEQAPHPTSLICALINHVEPVACRGLRSFSFQQCEVVSEWECSMAGCGATIYCHCDIASDSLESWVQVVGQDATAFVDLRRNCIQVWGKRQCRTPFDYLSATTRNGVSLCFQAFDNLRSFTSTTFKYGRPGDIFLQSMSSSIEAFYSGLKSPVSVDETYSAAAVVRVCSKLAALLEAQRA